MYIHNMLYLLIYLVPRKVRTKEKHVFWLNNSILCSVECTVGLIEFRTLSSSRLLQMTKLDRKTGDRRLSVAIFE